MNSWVIVFVAFVATATASVILPTTKVLEGPSTRTTLAGPDGSLISSEAAGGRIILESETLPLITEPALITKTSPTILTKVSPHIIEHSPAIVAETPAVLAKADPAVLAENSVIITDSAATVLAKSSPTVLADTSAIVTDAAPAILAKAPTVLTKVSPNIIVKTSPHLIAHSILEHQPIVHAYPSAYLANGFVSENSLDTLIAGPSGTISTRKSFTGSHLFAEPYAYAYGIHPIHL